MHFGRLNQNTFKVIDFRSVFIQLFWINTVHSCSWPGLDIFTLSPTCLSLSFFFYLLLPSLHVGFSPLFCLLAFILSAHLNHSLSTFLNWIIINSTTVQGQRCCFYFVANRQIARSLRMSWSTPTTLPPISRSTLIDLHFVLHTASYLLTYSLLCLLRLDLTMPRIWLQPSFTDKQLINTYTIYFICLARSKTNPLFPQLTLSKVTIAYSLLSNC